MRSSFYITLPSNSSIGYYPNNTVTNYITQLSHPIRLEGEWEVAVVEVIYPCTFLTLTESSKIFLYVNTNLNTDSATSDQDSKTPNTEDELSIPILKIFSIPEKEYNDGKEVVNTINKLEEFTKYAMFDFDRNTKKVTIHTRPQVFQMELTHTLALQLGFDPNENDLITHNKSIRPSDLHLGLPHQIYIYCDIVDMQFIGDTMAPLIQMATVDTTNYTHGANKSVQFLNPHYIPVLKSSFESIEIDLRDHTGKPLAFQFGTSCVKLHFRRIIEN